MIFHAEDDAEAGRASGAGGIISLEKVAQSVTADLSCCIIDHHKNTPYSHAHYALLYVYYTNVSRTRPTESP